MLFWGSSAAWTHGHQSGAAEDSTVNSAGLQIADFDYKEQIHFTAWFACHCLCLISFLYPSQTDGVTQRSPIYVYAPGLAFRFFCLHLIGVNMYLCSVLGTKKRTNLWALGRLDQPSCGQWEVTEWFGREVME